MNLSREIGSFIEHGNQHAFDLEGRVSLTADLSDRLYQFRDPFKREIFTLDRNQYAVRRYEGIHRKQVQGGRAVHDDEIIGAISAANGAISL